MSIYQYNILHNALNSKKIIPEWYISNARKHAFYHLASECSRTKSEYMFDKKKSQF